VPRSWYFVGHLPQTASGKVQKFILRDQAATGQLGSVSVTATRTF
jgi:acyl-coenzyme A synthetase/AMP-(fatty) acid ligase